MQNKTAHILLVEDNLNDIELIKLSLSHQLVPSQITVVNDGIEALDYLSNPFIPLPDLVLLDLYMPKMSGLEVLKKLREEERTQDLPVIIFTSSEEQEDLLKSYDLGANAYLKKGLEPEAFKAALKNLDIYWLLKNV